MPDTITYAALMNVLWPALVGMIGAIYLNLRHEIQDLKKQVQDTNRCLSDLEKNLPLYYTLKADHSAFESRVIERLDQIMNVLSNKADRHDRTL